MSIYQLALQMEQEGERFYRELANNAVNNGFKTIFTMLAEDEVEHQRIFKALQASAPLPDTVATPVPFKSIFAEWKKDGALSELDTSQLEQYQQALEIERKSQDLYRQEAEQTVDPGLKQIFSQLAAQEQQHFILIHNIVELMLHPQTWVENGEFYHLEEY